MRFPIKILSYKIANEFHNQLKIIILSIEAKKLSPIKYSFLRCVDCEIFYNIDLWANTVA